MDSGSDPARRTLVSGSAPLAGFDKLACHQVTTARGMILAIFSLANVSYFSFDIIKVVLT